MIILSGENFTDWVAIIFTNYCHILYSTSELVRTGGGYWSYQLPGSRLYITSCYDRGWHQTRHHPVLWHVDITPDTHNSDVIGNLYLENSCPYITGCHVQVLSNLPGVASTGKNSNQYNQNWELGKNEDATQIKMQCEENCINVNIILAGTFYFWRKIKTVLCSDPKYTNLNMDQIMVIAWRKKRWEILVLNLCISSPKHLGIN